MSAVTTSATAPALTVRGLVKRYADVVAVNGLDLEVRTGECFGLLGPNGAGKTTTIEICEGLTEPDAGEVVVLGRRWSDGARTLLVQPFIKALPLTATIDSLRAVMLQGATLASQSVNLAILVAWLVVTYALALRLFQWR